jgi:hypothetical protein
MKAGVSAKYSNFVTTRADGAYSALERVAA